MNSQNYEYTIHKDGRVEFEEYLKSQGFECNDLGGMQPFQMEAYNNKANINIYFWMRSTNVCFYNLSSILIITLFLIKFSYPNAGRVGFYTALCIFHYLWSNIKDSVFE